MSNAYDESDREEELRPRAWGGPVGRRIPTYVALHGAYHVLTQRIEIDTSEYALSPSEAVVLTVARQNPGAAIAVIRHATGLRRSTMTSLLERLEARDYVRRVRDPFDHRFAHLEISPSGAAAAEIASTVLEDLDPELSVFVAPDLLRAVDAVFEASRALGVPGTAADV